MEPIVTEHKDKLKRMRITDKIPKSKIIKAYRVYRSANKAAQVLRINIKTVLKILKAEGIDVNAISTEALKKPHLKYSQFAVWLRKHPGEKLPRSIKAIAEKTGCTADAIKCYMYRRRKEVKDKLNLFPSLKEISGKYEDVFGDTFLSSDIEKYSWHVDTYSLDVSFEATLKDGRLVQVLIEDPQHFGKAIVKMVKTL